MATTVPASRPVVLAGSARWIGGSLALLAVIASVTGTWLASGPGGRSLDRLMGDNVLTNAVNGIEIGVIAGVLILLRQANRVGWLLLYVGIVNAISILGEGWALASYQLELPGRMPMAWLASWVWATALILGATVLPAIYPTGRAVGRFGRWVVRLGWAFSLIMGAALSGLTETFRSSVPGHDVGENPLTGGRFEPVLIGIGVTAAVGGIALVIATLVWTIRRLRHAVSPEREQLAWLMASVIPSILVGFVAPPPVAFVVNLLTSVALVIGIVRYQLFDIKLVLRRGLVYGLLIALAVGAYFGVVELITLVTPSGTVPSLFAAATAALLLRPAYTRLTRAVGRLVYGDRDDPVRALRRTADTGNDLEAMVRSVAASVRSPHVAVLGPAGDLIAGIGVANEHPAHRVPLWHDGAEVGTLVVAWRGSTERLSATDRRLVEALAVPVAVAIRASQLATEVGESRARAIAVRESERRTLRNDLHDGLGPSLSGVALGIEAARRAEDVGRVREILEVVHGEVTGLVGEVRSIIDDLGAAGPAPGGLVTALRAHAEAISALGELRVDVDATPLPELIGAVELALHRIAAEALTNVVRHSGAHRAAVSVSSDRGFVRLTVTDDGGGIGIAPAGVGRSSMRERAESLGGTLNIADALGGGTVVVAQLPLSGAAPEGASHA